MLEWARWSGRFARLNVQVLAFVAAFAAFDARLYALRLGTTVAPDALVNYYWILDWWRNGNSPRGFTLTPSPYFIDILLQLPITLFAPDYEAFAYALAALYAVLLFVSLFLVTRVVLAASSTFSMFVTGAVIASFYALAPVNFVFHAFIVNHTSEVFTTLGLLVLVQRRLPGPERPSERTVAILYALVVALCVTSSPFFISTYCIPASLGAAALLGTVHVSRRRLLWFWGLTALGAVVGLISLALISRYVWPVRGDSYLRWRKSYIAFKAAIAAEPGGVQAAVATSLAFAASFVLVAIARLRAWRAPLLFMFAFFPAAVLACVALPIKRGAFDNAYAFRYVQLPWLLTVAFYVCGAAHLAKLLWRRIEMRAGRRWQPWGSVVLGVISIALVARCHGPFTMDDRRSLPASMIQCFRDADQKGGGLKDGLAMWWLGRFFRAAEHTWGSDHVIVHIRWDGRIDPWDNNVLWFTDGFRHGQSDVNFLVTHGLGDDILDMFRDRIGRPDRTVVCAVPEGQRLDGKPTFELWIWDRKEARQALTHMLLADNLRSSFSPAVGATRMAIDPVWGMDSASEATELREGHRLWRRVGDGAPGAAISMVSMWVPSGHYRLEMNVSVPERSSQPGPLFDVQIKQVHKGQLARVSIAEVTQPVSVEFDVHNRGGATSGDAIMMDLIPQSAQSLDVASATLVLVEQAGISPFQIFR